MRKLLGTLVLICLIVGAIGFFRGWFDVSQVDEPGQTNVQITIDKEKIKQDAETAKEKVQDLRGDADDTDAEFSDESEPPSGE